MPEDENVKDWYLLNYPSDELGVEINPQITFNDVFNALDKHADIYGLLKVHDSLVRERVFERLAEVMSVDYDYVYDQWLMSR